QAGRLALWSMSGLGAAVAADPVADLLRRHWPVFADQPGLFGVKALLVPAITAGPVVRYAPRPQHVNRSSGLQTRPRAAASAVAAYTATAALGLARAFDLVTGYVGLWPIAAAVVAGITGSVLQQKDVARTRLIKAAVSGTLSAAVAFVISTLGGGPAPGA